MNINTHKLKQQIEELTEEIESEGGEVKVAIGDYFYKGKKVQVFLTVTDDEDLLWEETHPERICVKPNHKDNNGERLKLDEGVVSAIKLWYSHGFDPGAFCMCLLEGDKEGAWERAHELLKPYFDDHLKYVSELPIEGRGKNIKTFKGGIEI